MSSSEGDSEKIKKGKVDAEKNPPQPLHADKRDDTKEEIHEVEGHDNDEGDENEVEKETVEEVLTRLEATLEGLTNSEAEARLLRDGPNTIEEKKVSPVLQYLGFFWNPLSWAMEVTAIASAILVDWLDAVLIVGLLILNATLGFYEEHNASNAIEALKEQLAPTAWVRRDGEWKEQDAKHLVAGDKVRLKIGDIVPADCKVVKAVSVKVDQSALTGESLPVEKKAGTLVYSGSAVKQGELEAIVVATGKNSFFGRSAGLVDQSGNKGHFQRILTRIGYFCIFFILFFVILEIIIQFAIRQKPCRSVTRCYDLENVLVLIVGGVPIAMPTVLSVTMAIGASKLSKQKAIVSRLSAVEELAGMDILCSDKTGTLTQNKLEVDDPVCIGDNKPDDVVFDAALASKRDDPDDPIDSAIVQRIQAGPRKEELSQYQTLDFEPFNPESKRTTAKIQGPNGLIWVSKGAPQVIQEMAINRAETEELVSKTINDFAERGFRALGVAKATDPEGKNWEIEGLIPLSDPPRHDTKETVENVIKNGIQVKMITGDQQAIGREVARRIGMGNNILNAKTLPKKEQATAETDKMIESADGFAQVLPEDKFNIVRTLQRMGHIVGMTGDGVNDAPALKRADIGIAVSGATSAARAASDIVLTSPGLGVISAAILGSRVIFQRMKNYSTYAISVTVRLVLTFFFITVIWDFLYPTVIIVILAVFNDGTILTISRDRVKPSNKPDQWNLLELFGSSVIMGTYLALSSIILFLLIHDTNWFPDWFGLRELSDERIRAVLYLQISITGFFSLFFIRTHRFFWETRPGWLLVGALVISQTAATFLAVYGLAGYPHHGRGFRGCGWGWALFTWIWSFLWLVPMDGIKLGSRWIMRKFSVFWEKHRPPKRQKAAHKKGLLEKLHINPHLKSSFKAFKEERTQKKEEKRRQKEEKKSQKEHHAPAKVHEKEEVVEEEKPVRDRAVVEKVAEKPEKVVEEKRGGDSTQSDLDTSDWSSDSE